MFTRALSGFIFIFVFLSGLVVAQQPSDAQRLNQAFFNKIEFHLNQQETDSVYAMTSAAFQRAVPIDAFRMVIQQQIYLRGGIRDAELLDFDNNVATYKLVLGQASSQLSMSLDSENMISLLTLQSYQAPKEPTVAEDVPLISDVDKRIDAIAGNYVKKANTRGLAIGVIKDGRTSHYFYGETARGTKELPTESTTFEIGSISKTFTATLLAYLVEQDRLSLDDTITKFLPDSLAENESLQRITLKHLANHTSGLPRLSPDLMLISAEHPLDPYRGYSKAHLYSYLKEFKASREPEEAYEYSNLGYAVLGTILTSVYDKDYNALVREIIAGPLKLTNTTQYPDTVKHRLPPVHNQEGAVTPYWSFDAYEGAGALKSTISDLLLYAKAHFKNPETELEYALSLTRQFTYFNPPDTDIGLAWHMATRGGYLIYQHTGGTYGSSSYIAFSPDKRLAVVVLSNAAESTAATGDAVLEFLLEVD